MDKYQSKLIKDIYIDLNSLLVYQSQHRTFKIKVINLRK